MLKSPCKHNCPDRQPGCHSKCERYLAYAETISEARERRQKYRESEMDFYGVRRRR